MFEFTIDQFISLVPCKDNTQLSKSDKYSTKSSFSDSFSEN
ncbi:hypothetical protein BACFIN_06049 [Bacteroides finegoldii DSM 17565]|nr:hypothetical protein BACFIN_06049 [Bacteroides finegoldii DSM 17565]